jgi:hypothetical protein
MVRNCAERNFGHLMAGVENISFREKRKQQAGTDLSVPSNTYRDYSDELQAARECFTRNVDAFRQHYAGHVPVSEAVFQYSQHREPQGRMP